VDSTLEAVQQQVTSLTQQTQLDLDHLRERIEDVTDDVTELGGGPESRKFLSKLFAGSIYFEFRRWCELYAWTEVQAICLNAGFKNPEPYWVHLECGPINEGFIEPCPDKFWKMDVGCFRPNGPRFPECAYDPLPRNETCSRLVYISCEGYTENIAEDWYKYDFDQPLTKNHTEEHP